MTDLFEDGEGYLWIATQDGGLTRYRDGTFQRFGSGGGLPATIYGVGEDTEKIWAGGEDGHFRGEERRTSCVHGRDSGWCSRYCLWNRRWAEGARMQWG